jgi:hypothetical protein
VPDGDLPANTPHPAVDLSAPVFFLGLADGVALQNPSTPFEAWSLFQLAKVKPHIAFPAIMRQAFWCFLLRTDTWRPDLNIRVQIVNSAGVEQGHLNFATAPIVAVPNARSEAASVGDQLPTDDGGAIRAFLLDIGQLMVQGSAIPDLIIPEPGEYRLLARWDGQTSYLGRVVFVFAPPPALTEEQISAYESDPVSHKFVKFTYGCKKCDSKLRAYAAAKKSPEVEKEGFIFYPDLPDRFICSCGATNLPLEYMRLGMHGFLGRDSRISVGDISYVQRYAHSQLLDIAGKFLNLIQREKKEEPVQRFLAQHKVLFARFHARQLFVKPRILGKFNADFAILDSEGALTLIEIERPSMRLFKKNGHLRNDLNHAYEQVHDWLNEVLNHKSAVIEGLGLKPDDVLSVRGCVIAGRAKLENREHLRRHMSQPRQGIEFFTFDMLGHSLTRIAHDLP